MTAFNSELPICANDFSDLPETGWCWEPTNKYLVHRIDEKRYKAIAPFIYTSAIITGRIGDAWGYDQRWCYDNHAIALIHATVWDGAEDTDPDGWHRHLATGRRRPNGDASLEYVSH